MVKGQRPRGGSWDGASGGFEEFKNYDRQNEALNYFTMALDACLGDLKVTVWPFLLALLGQTFKSFEEWEL